MRFDHGFGIKNFDIRPDALDALEYSTNFFCQKIKKYSNIRSRRIFDEFRAHERRSNIRRL